MDAISATRRTAKQLVDGTWAVTLHIDPIHSGEFLRLFPNVDMPVALAPLVADFEQRKIEKPRSQLPSQWLALRCQENLFRGFLAQFNGGLEPVNDSEAADVLRNVLRVNSRAECDIDPEARDRFNDLRLQWVDYSVEHDL